MSWSFRMCNNNPFLWYRFEKHLWQKYRESLPSPAEMRIPLLAKFVSPSVYYFHFFYVNLR